MRGFVIQGIGLLLLTGCMSNSSLETMAMTQENVWNLSRLCVGMNESQVLRVMQHPYTKKTMTHEGTVYNIWFYVTSPTSLRQSRLIYQNLTPLTFANGILQGWGFEFYHRVLKKFERPESKTKAPEKAPPEEGSGRLQKTIDAIQKKPVSLDDSQQKPKQTKPKPNEKEKKPDSQVPSKEKDDKRDKAIQQDNDQNFDFW